MARARTTTDDILWVDGVYSKGMVRDLPRSLVPEGGAVTLQDFLLDQPGKLYKRGGSSFASAAVVHDIIIAVAACNFSGDPRLIMIGSTGATQTVYDITGGSGSAINAGNVNRTPTENPTFWVDKLIVCEGLQATTVIPKKVYLSGANVAVADLGGTTPPSARYSCVHLGRLVLANSTAYPNRLWFSGDNDAESWTVDSHYNTSGPITGLASIGGVLVIFHRRSAERLLGQIPSGFDTSSPTALLGDMELQPMMDVGCMDARTIVKGNDVVYFADESGVYYTNTGGPVSLTTKPDGSGISSFWRNLTKDLDGSSGAVVASGLYNNDWLLITIRHPSGPDTQLICYLPTGAWSTTSTNIACDMYTSRVAPTAKIYGANANTSQPIRAIDLTTLFTPYPGGKADANSEAVTPILETRMIGEGPGLKAYGDLHITYDMRDAASDNPTLAVALAKGVEATSYTAAAESPLAESTDAVRHRFTGSKDSQALFLKVTQANASSRTEIYSIEALWRPYTVADNQ